MSFGSEFKEFALKGNVMDLAVGVIIGGAFGKIVDSVVGDLIMPLVSRVTGRLDFLIAATARCTAPASPTSRWKPVRMGWTSGGWMACVSPPPPSPR